MMLYRVLITSVLAMMLLGGCDKAQQPQDKNTSAKIMFMEYEKYVKPYPTRLIVTDKYMRFDDGEGSQSYILFNRDTQTIYSVRGDERTVMSVKQKDVELEPPFELKLEEKNLGGMKDAPQIQGKEPLHYQFSANGEICYNVVAVKDLMPGVVNAMQEFTKVLASDSKITFHTIPADLHNACDMSMSTFAAGRHLKHGFPIQEWSEKGDGRNLVDYDENYEPDPSLFELPKDYQSFSVQDFREGKVDVAD